MRTGVIDKDVLYYLPAMQQILYQGMTYGINTKRYANLTSKDMQTLLSNMKLPENYYMNGNIVHIVLPIQLERAKLRQMT